jgi:glycosyltransferase involved in cell wall biosynthesis
MRVSVIVSTYNRPDALRAVLEGLSAQNDRAYEVVVADDGSRGDTRELLDKARIEFPVPLSHVWQDDRGFRAGAARNRAVERAHGDYLVFLDGDCIPRSDFITRHRALAERGRMLAGNRILLSDAFTTRALEEALPLHSWTLQEWKDAYRRGYINRVAPLLNLPLGPLRKLASRRWQRVRTCNLGVWMDDFQRVRGFDESFEGWGFEDSDLAVRLINSGVRRKEGAFATGVLHLWHPENDRKHEGRNWELLQRRLRSRETLPVKGLAPVPGYG